MSKPDAPFLITVCGIEELAGHADRKVSHVLSILDPDHAEPEAFGAYGEHARLVLNFHDVIEDTPAFQAPQPAHVEKILEFGRDILHEPASVGHLLVHCHMGISRSTAAMTLLLAQAQPELSAQDGAFAGRRDTRKSLAQSAPAHFWRGATRKKRRVYGRSC